LDRAFRVRLRLRGEGAGAAPGGPARGRSPDPTEAVKLLAGLLAAHPQVNIYHTTRRVRLIYPPGWSEVKTAGLRRNLGPGLFGPGVINYILDHPRREITAENIIPKEEAHEKA